MASADKKYTDKYAGNGNGKASQKKATDVSGSNAQKGFGTLEQTMRDMGEQLGDNLTNVMVATALSKVFSNLANGDYGTVGNNYIDVLQAFSEGIESSNLALLASENTTNFLPAGSNPVPENQSLTVSKLDS